MSPKSEAARPSGPVRPVLDRRSMIIGAGLGLAGAISVFRTPQPVQSPIPSNIFRDGIPSRIAGWTSRRSTELVLPTLDDGAKIYENVETRIYEGPNIPSIMFLIAFSSIQHNNIQVHRPEVCYSVSGYPITWTKTTRIEILNKQYDGRELVADRGGFNERIIYFVRVADQFATDWSQQRFAMARSYLSGTIPDGVLFRVSMIEEPDQDPSPILRDFIDKFTKAVDHRFLEQVIL